LIIYDDYVTPSPLPSPITHHLPATININSSVVTQQSTYISIGDGLVTSIWYRHPPRGHRCRRGEYFSSSTIDNRQHSIVSSLPTSSSIIPSLMRQ